MKLLALSALFVASIVGQKCNPDTLHAKFYTDKNCKNFDEAKTKALGATTGANKKFLSGKCETGASEGELKAAIITCPAEGYTAKGWTNAKCTGPNQAQWIAKWGKCTFAGPKEYVKMFK